MADCEWLILCDSAFQGEHRKLSLIGIFNTIFTANVPAVQLKCAIGFGLVGEPGEHIHGTVEILAPSSQVIFAARFETALPDEGSSSLPMELPPLQLPEFGQYAVQLDIKNGQPTSAWFALKPLPS